MFVPGMVVFTVPVVVTVTGLPEQLSTAVTESANKLLIVKISGLPPFTVMMGWQGEVMAKINPPSWPSPVALPVQVRLMVPFVSTVAVPTYVILFVVGVNNPLLVTRIGLPPTDGQVIFPAAPAPFQA